MFTQTVGMPDFIGLEVIGHARQLAQLDDGGADERDLMERAVIGSKRRGQRLCVPAVVLGARRREAVSTTGPCGTSIATWISLGLPPLVAMSQSHICASPAPLCSKVRSQGARRWRR